MSFNQIISLQVNQIFKATLNVCVHAHLIVLRNALTGSDFEDGCGEPSPNIGNALRKVVRESPLLKGGDAVCDDVSYLGQISKVAPHCQETWLKREKKTKKTYIYSQFIPYLECAPKQPTLCARD